MTANDGASFLMAMKRLAIATRAELDDATVPVYFDALLDIPLDVIQQAERRLERDCKYFPTPAEWRNAADDVVDDSDVSTMCTTGTSDEIEHCVVCGDTGWCPGPAQTSSEPVRYGPCSCRPINKTFRANHPLPRRWFAGRGGRAR